METQNPITQPVTAPTTPPTPEQKPKSSKRIITVIVVLFLLAVGGSAAYFLSKNVKTQPKNAIVAPTPTIAINKTVTNNLNPNTGNLYKDIKVRLKEVLK